MVVPHVSSCNSFKKWNRWWFSYFFFLHIIPYVTQVAACIYLMHGLVFSQQTVACVCDVVVELFGWASHGLPHHFFLGLLFAFIFVSLMYPQCILKIAYMCLHTRQLLSMMYVWYYIIVFWDKLVNFLFLEWHLFANLIVMLICSNIVDHQIFATLFYKIHMVNLILQHNILYLKITHLSFSTYKSSSIFPLCIVLCECDSQCN